MLSSLLLLAATTPAAIVTTDHLRSQLVAESTAAVPGQTLRLGLLLDHAPHWHTYWVNPGDSGLPTRLQWRLPQGVEASEVAWPMPRRFDLGGIVNYGYEGRALLPVALQLPARLDGDELVVELEARWLICQEECIPGQGRYRLALPLAAAAKPDPRWQPAFEHADRAQPQPLEVSASLGQSDAMLVLRLQGELPAGMAAAEWFPRTPRLVANSAKPTWQDSGNGGELHWPASEFFTALPADSEWWFRLGEQHYRLHASRPNFTSDTTD